MHTIRWAWQLRFTFIFAASISARFVQAEEVAPEEIAPIALRNSVHLLLDDHYIGDSRGIERVVMPPERFLDGPVITCAPEHQNWQPFLTVLHDRDSPNGRPFRMWYNVDVIDDPTDGEYFGATGYLESVDGIHWPGPYQRLTSLPIDGRVRFGACVLDEGRPHPIPAERYKMLYFDAGASAGPRVAFSADGLHWTPHDEGRPVLATNNGDDIWSAGYDPIRQRYFLFGKTFGPFTWKNADGLEVTASIRRYFDSFSHDFQTWSEPRMIFSPDADDAGVTQWYGPAGFLVRGDLIIAFLRVLRDDLSPAGVPPEAIEANTRGPAGLGASGLGTAGGSGMGYTVLAWTRDGNNWQRDRHVDAYFAPDPRVGAWDHAMAWIGSSVEVDDDLYLYYAGYRWGHKHRHSVDRQLGVVKARRDRFVARRGGNAGGTITTHPLILESSALLLNVDARNGEARVQITDAGGQPLPGFSFADCQPISGDSLDATITWARPISELRGQTVRLEFSLRHASLFAFETQ